MEQKKTERQKLIEVIQKLNINIPKKKNYISNSELKNLILDYVNFSKKKKIDLTSELKKKEISKKKIDIESETPLDINIKKSRYPKVEKLIAIGDIHGDLTVAIKALKLAKVIDENISNNTKDINKINWIGGKTVVVQLGDQIDRVRPNELVNDLCPENDTELNQDEGSDLKIICLFEKLHGQAIKQGGALFSILGNHELMNVEGDFRYVSPKEFKEFGKFFKEKKNINSNLPYGYDSRKKVFQPGGLLAKKLSNTRYSILQIGSWIFVHGSLGPKISNDYTIDEINVYIKNWLSNDINQDSIKHINKIYNNDDESYSPFWSRTFSDLDTWNEDLNTKLFKSTLDILNKKNKRTPRTLIKGMIVGHSPQFMFNKGINSSCDNCIWRVDIGASRAFGLVNNSKQNSNRKVQVLEIINDKKFRILKEN